MKQKILASLLLSSLPFLSVAATYDAFVSEESQVNFTYQQMGVSLDGTFEKFEGNLSFDTENPEAATASVSIPLASVDTGTSEGNDEVAGKSWFNLAEFPNASFESTQVKALDNGQFQVSGTLSIKGSSKDIEFPATFKEDGNKGTFAGEFTINRGDFAIGEGMWAKYDIVANEVTIRFSLVAQSN